MAWMLPWLTMAPGLRIRAQAESSEPWRLATVELTRSNTLVWSPPQSTRGGGYFADPVTLLVVESPPPHASTSRSPSLNDDLLGNLDPGAEPTEHSPALPMNPGYWVETWKAEHGLPSNRVRCLQATRDGYLWIGTLHGVARFDGTHFQTFNAANTPAFANSSEDVRCLKEDLHGNLWLGTGSGVVMKTGSTFHIPHPSSAIRNERIQSIVLTKAGTMFMASRDALWQVVSNSLERIPVPDAGPNGVANMVEDAQGKLWVSCGSLFHSYDPKLQRWLRETEPEKYPSGARVFFSDRDGSIWIAGAGLRRLDRGVWESPLPHAIEPDYPSLDWPIWNLTSTPSRDIWMVAGFATNNIWRLQGTNMVKFHSDLHPIPEARCIESDEGGNIWVGTKGAGLFRIHPRRVGHLQLLFQGASFKFGSVVENRDGSIWATTEAGFFHWSHRSLTILNTTNASHEKHPLPIIALKHGGTWAAHPRSGLFRLPQNQRDPSWNQQVTPNLPEVGRVQCLTEGPDSTLWMGTVNGLYSYGNTLHKWSIGETLGADHIRVLSWDPHGRLWIGTSKGLWILQQGQFIPITGNDRQPFKPVISILHDSSGQTWLGSENGLLVSTPRQHLSLSDLHPQFSQPIHQILEDSVGSLWISYHGGLTRVRKSDLQDALSRHSKSVHGQSYGEAEGLLSIEMASTPQPAGCKGRDGRLYFPSLRGLVVVLPHEEAEPARPQQTDLESLRVDGVEWPLDAIPNNPTTARTPIHFESQPGQGRTLDIRFNAAHLAASSRLKFRYRLLGHEESWHETSSDRRAIYSGLSPGQFRFQVCAAVGTGPWNDPQTLFHAYLIPTLWERPAFWVLCSCSLVMVTTSLIHWRFRTQKQIHGLQAKVALDLERTRIARDLHDELGSSLAVLLAMARRKQPAAPPEVSTPDTSDPMPTKSTSSPSEDQKLSPVDMQVMGNMISDLSRRLKDMVWLLDPRQESTDQFASHILQYAESAVQLAQKRLRVDFPESLPPVYLDARTRSHLSAIFKEALANALQHSSCTTIHIQLEATPQLLAFSVTDDGQGFAIDHVQKGHGLRNLEDRARMIHAHLQLIPLHPTGTTIRLEMPCPSTSSVEAQRRL